MKNRVLFITDECELEKEYSIKRKDGEGNRLSGKIEMEKALQNIFKSVLTTYSVKEACKYITTIKDLFVVTTYYGIAEADSKSIIPALCKANGVNYLGADSYTHMICNDKYLSKYYIKQFGLTPIPGVIIYSPELEYEYIQLDKLKYPVIVKPNFGGGSNGIINSAVKYSKNEAIDYIKELYKYQKMPIIVEEYIPGFEISAIIVGNKSKINIFDEAELVINGKSFFETEVFGLEYKKIDTSTRQYISSKHIDDETKEKMIRLFQSFDKVEFMRIDCRVDINKNIYVIELSPDCNIGSTGMFFSVVKKMGISFNDLIELLINNSISNQNN